MDSYNKIYSFVKGKKGKKLKFMVYFFLTEIFIFQSQIDQPI